MALAELGFGFGGPSFSLSWCQRAWLAGTGLLPADMENELIHPRVLLPRPRTPNIANFGKQITEV